MSDMMLLAAALSACSMFAIGIMYGWSCKERYPGNPENPEEHERESKIYVKGYNKGFKAGVEHGKKRMLEDLLIYKTKMEEEK